MVANTADLNDKRLAPIKTRKRKGGRPPLTDTVSIRMTGSSRSGTRLTFSRDLIEKLLRKRDGPGSALTRFTETGLRMEIMSFSDKSIPAAFVRLAKPSFNPRDPRLLRTPGGKTYYAHAACKHLSIRNDIPATTLKTLWIDNPSGLLVIFPDDFMLDPGGKLDPEIAFAK